MFSLNNVRDTQSYGRPKFKTGIRRGILLTDFRINEKSGSYLTVSFEDTENGATNVTNIFEPSKVGKTQVNKVTKVCMDVLACILKKPNETLDETREAIKKEIKDCNTWTEFMRQIETEARKGFKQHKELYGTDKVNVCGVWVYNCNGYVNLRQSFDVDIMRTDCISLADERQYFVINERDILEKQISSWSGTRSKFPYRRASRWQHN